jgi:hypothetical protein
LLVIVAISSRQAFAEGLRVGRAAVDITPPIGTPMLTPQRPPFEVKLAGQAHDPLHAKALVLEQAGARAALVTCDLTSLPLRMHQEARRLIGEVCEVDAESVMISATHTHTAPQIRTKYLGNADDAARKLAIEYVSSLPGKIAEAVRRAEADLQPAQASAGLGEEGSVSFNRRFFLRDGTVMANPFKGEDEKLGQVLRPAGPIDPQVGVVSFAGADGKPLALLVNFAIHLDTMGGDQPSADLAGELQKQVQTAHGPETLALWCSGASGNINHYDLMDPAHPRREKGPHETQRIGAAVAGEALRTYAALNSLEDAPLRVAREVVRLDYHPDKAPALLARMKDTPQFFDGEVDVFNDGGKLSFDAEVQVIALGNELAWVGLPGEMFTEFGLNLKNASPFRYTTIHSLANGAIGYVPNLRAYPERAREDMATRCAPGAGERLIESATHLLIKLKNDGRGEVDANLTAAAQGDPS